MAETLSCEELEEKVKFKHQSIFDNYHGEREWQRQEAKSNKSYDKIPIPNPKYAGEDLQLNANLVKAGFSAISIKHQPQYQRFSQGCRWMAYPHSRANLVSSQQCHNPKSIQPRNSYPALHHPELMNLKWVKALNPNNRKEEIEKFLHEHTTLHGSFCSSLHCSVKEKTSKATSPHQMIHEVQLDNISSLRESKLEGANETELTKKNKVTKAIEAEDSEIIGIPITGLEYSKDDLGRETGQLSIKSMDEENHQRYIQPREENEDNQKFSIELNTATQENTVNNTKFINSSCGKGATARPRCSRKELCHEKDKMRKNIKEEELEVIVPPIPRTDSSIENVLLENAQPSEEFLDIQDLRRGTGSGEDEPLCTEPIYDEEGYQEDSDTEVTEVVGEAGAIVQTSRVPGEERSIHKALRKSPAKMWITAGRECCHPEPWVVENKEMAPYKSLQEVVKTRLAEEKCGGNNLISCGENAKIGSYFSVPETTPAERSVWQMCTHELESNRIRKERVKYDTINHRDSMESTEWERSNERACHKDVP
ncbi:uncharacterized protein LOC124157297 [Ischnura elegans]|uniref:uncharacterized protein LOC124157297 n=1 Tax=Ischnura elegans TaxID=197161 RepID=UPI001ED87304|nr:uncharacterized protein LOC124157297 [Ischnura elegans]